MVTALLVVYGVALVLIMLVLVGLVQRLQFLERSNRPAPKLPPVPEWVAPKVTADGSHHLVIVVDDTCSVCHQTVERLERYAENTPGVAASITILTHSDAFNTTLNVLVSDTEHRVLHPGWTPAGLVYSARGLEDRLPVGSAESVEHALHKLGLLQSS